ncbi:MAG: JAB domain-containing protein [Gammaproteobacteria bacterium]
MAINDWPEAERPREKLVARGPQALSDAELLAIFLRTGIRGKTAMDLARELLAEFKGLRGLFAAERDRLCTARGLGPAKYAQLQAVLEMARRHLGESLQRGMQLTDPAATRGYLITRLPDLPQEALRKTLAHNAAALIFHNHPSGVAEPSDADRWLTQRLKDALALVDIRVLDHCVVGDGEAVSFAERGLLFKDHV